MAGEAKDIPEVQFENPSKVTRVQVRAVLPPSPISEVETPSPAPLLPADRATLVVSPRSKRKSLWQYFIPGGERVPDMKPAEKFYADKEQESEHKAAEKQLQGEVALMTGEFCGEATQKIRRVIVKSGKKEDKAYANGANRGISWDFPAEGEPDFSYDRPRYTFTAEYFREGTSIKNRVGKLWRNIRAGGVAKEEDPLPKIDLKRLEVSYTIPGQWEHDTNRANLSFNFQDGKLQEAYFKADYYDISDPARLAKITDENPLIVKLREIIGANKEYDETNTGRAAIQLTVGPFYPHIFLYRQDLKREYVYDRKKHRSIPEYKNSGGGQQVHLHFEGDRANNEFVQGRTEYHTFEGEPLKIATQEYKDMIMDAIHLIPLRAIQSSPEAQPV